MSDDSRFVNDPARVRWLLMTDLQLRPWPTPAAWLNSAPVSRPLFHAAQGFVRNERFGPGRVIQGTNRAKQRKGGYQIASDSANVR